MFNKYLLTVSDQKFVVLMNIDNKDPTNTWRYPNDIKKSISSAIDYADSRFKEKNLENNFSIQFYDEEFKEWINIGGMMPYDMKHVTQIRLITKKKIEIDIIDEASFSDVSTQCDEIHKEKSPHCDERLKKKDFRFIHIKDNPFQWRCEQLKEQLKKLTEDNKRLQVKVEMLKQGNAEVTRHLNDAVAHSDYVETLERELKEAKDAQQSIMDGFKKKSKEFREVVYLLTGYKFDALKQRIYKLTHVHADAEDYLMFTLDSAGAIQLLDTAFSGKYTDLVEQYLMKFDSFPVFLGALTLRLFKQNHSENSMVDCSHVEL